jgi:glycosyltransferase involved in cell wall biosynthesis
VAADPKAAKVLVVSPRPPAADGKGDQLRAFQFVCELAREHPVEVVTTGRGDTLPAHVVIRRVTPLARALGALGALARGQPAQVGWMTPGSAWRTIERRAAQADVVLALTVRSVRGPLAAPLILDHIDALSLNARRRATGPEPLPVRWAARAEAALLRRWERRVAGWAAVQAVISHVDARELPPPVQVLPNSVGLAPALSHPPRDIDVVLTGNMAYPPNRDAARWLSDAIAPALWRRRPGASIWVVGRDAGRLELDPRLQVRSDVPDVADYLRRAKLALAPLRIGTGSPNKVLEAMAAGAAVVATPEAVAPFAFGAGAVATGDGTQALALELDRLLADERERGRLAARALDVLADYDAAAQRRRLEALVAQALRRR